MTHLTENQKRLLQQLRDEFENPTISSLENIIALGNDENHFSFAITWKTTGSCEYVVQLGTNNAGRIFVQIFGCNDNYVDSKKIKFYEEFAKMWFYGE